MDMKDELVGFEVAKLAKEKGFDVDCKTMLVDKDTYVGCLIPTQSLLQRWIREVHGVHILITPNYTYGEYTQDELPSKVNDEDVTYEIVVVQSMVAYDVEEYDELSDANTYEEALESGLLIGLRLI